MKETEPTQDLPPSEDDEWYPTDETDPSISPNIYTHIRLLYDGYLSNAIRKVLEAPVIVKVGADEYIHYPAPADAWQQDVAFRKWGYRVASKLHRQSVISQTRFNILFFINNIRNYDGNYQSFTAWYRREHPEEEASWTMQAILKAQSDGQRHSKPSLS
jgi:hypothetical protein